MTNQETPLKQGRICPVCQTVGEVDDLFCSTGCGHAFSDADPIVLLNADGTVHDPNEDKSAASAHPVDPAHDDDYSKQEPTPPPIPEFPQPPLPLTPPSPNPPPVNDPSLPAPLSSASSAATDDSAATSACKICYIEVSVDVDPRPLRPDDVVAPTVPSTGYTLSGPRVPFGRMSPVVPILGDPTVSRLHGYFHRTATGGYQLQCETENFTEVNGTEIAKGQTVELKDGDAIKIGDFFLIVYHEQD